MSSTEKQYTLLESFCIFCLVPFVVIPAVVLVAAVMFPLAMLTAWIRWKLWMWFCVPYLHLPYLPYWAVFALGCIVSTFHYGDAPNGYKPTTKESVSRVAVSMISQFIALGIGYIIHLYLR